MVLVVYILVGFHFSTFLEGCWTWLFFVGTRFRREDEGTGKGKAWENHGTPYVCDCLWVNFFKLSLELLVLGEYGNEVRP